MNNGKSMLPRKILNKELMLCFGDLEKESIACGRFTFGFKKKTILNY